MLYKTTKSLFQGKYKYKIVLVCAGAGMFRSGDMDAALEMIKQIDLNKNNIHLRYNNYLVKTAEELDYALQLQQQISKMQDFDIRIENPWVSIYTNSPRDVANLARINEDNVKYISQPPAKSSLEEGTVIMPKMNYDYRVTMGKTTHEHSAFVEWADTNAKLKLTKSCIRDLSKNRSWGGTHFYVSGDNNLLMAKMHLGGCITKVERIIKA
jgi:hypothetical protein